MVQARKRRRRRKKQRIIHDDRGTRTRKEKEARVEKPDHEGYGDTTPQSETIRDVGRNANGTYMHVTTPRDCGPQPQDKEAKNRGSAPGALSEVTISHRKLHESGSMLQESGEWCL